MSTWIVPIDRHNPEHWQYAKEHQFWDMKKRFDIVYGDRVFFWQAGEGLVGSVVVSESVRPKSDDEPMPWNVEDAKRAEYRQRFGFVVETVSIKDGPDWNTLKQFTGVPALQAPREIKSTDGEEWLAQFVSADGELTEAAIDRLKPRDASVSPGPEITLERMLEDNRRRTERIIALREGQPRFRAALMRAYESRCAISECAVVGVLEAAHVMPYQGGQTHDVANGLLLRSDLHTLFDKHLLTVTPSYEVRVSPSLRGSEYEALSGQSARQPVAASERVAESYLEWHNSECKAWFDRS